MLKFSKKTEYALMALGYIMTQGDQSICSVRGISDHFHISFPLLAKIMQQLASHGLISSSQGTKGGYQLAKPPHSISLADVVEIFDGAMAVADCFKEEKVSCPQWDGCKIKSPFGVLNQKIQTLLMETKVTDLMTDA